MSSVLNNNLSLKKLGFSTIVVPNKVRREIEDSIKISLQKKLYQNIDKKFIWDFSKLSNIIVKLSDINFTKFLGNNLSRYLDVEVSQTINEWIKKKPFKFNSKKTSLHYPRITDVQNSNYLAAKQFVSYYRCVRPNKNDVSYPHRDVDFWKLERHDNIKGPFKKKLIYKVWIPIYGCNNQNSLRLISKSHNKHIKISYKKKDGFLKPIVPESFMKKEQLLIKQPIKDFKTQGLIFDQKLVHFAPKNYNKKIRISVEFSVFSS